MSSVAVRDARLSDSQIAETLALAARAGIALVGIGHPTPGSVVRQSRILDEDTVDELAALGAVGDIGLRFYDAEGQAVSHEIDERITGLTLGQLVDILCVIGVAGGQEKLEVIRAALRGRLIDVLVTDVGNARRLLAAAGEA